MMNQRVSQLGLADTHFVNPHGLDTPGHYSSAYDIASLAWYALHIPTFNEIVRTGQYDAPGHALPGQVWASRVAAFADALAAAPSPSLMDPSTEPTATVEPTGTVTSSGSNFHILAT